MGSEETNNELENASGVTRVENQDEANDCFLSIVMDSLRLVVAQSIHHVSGNSIVAMAMAPPTMPMSNSQFIRKEKFADLIFPGFQEDSFIWRITCVQIIEFAISMFIGHRGPNPTPCVLYGLGASWGPAVARGQVWRLFTPVTLHANLSHLLFNLFFQLRMGFRMEQQFGSRKMMLIYFVCGLFGNLLSVAVDPFKLAVGASTAGFGLLGVWLAEIALSWNVLGPARERTSIWILFMIVSVISMSTGTPNLDVVGHIGGALAGFLLAIVISDMPEQHRPSWYGEARAGAAVGLGMILTCGLAKIMTGYHDPIPPCSLLSEIYSNGALA